MVPKKFREGYKFILMLVVLAYVDWLGMYGFPLPFVFYAAIGGFLILLALWMAWHRKTGLKPWIYLGLGIFQFFVAANASNFVPPAWVYSAWWMPFK